LEVRVTVVMAAVSGGLPYLIAHGLTAVVVDTNVVADLLLHYPHWAAPPLWRSPCSIRLLS
jgi:hypothetical protein